MSKQTMEIAKKRNPKLRKTKISPRNLTKSFRELLEEARNTITLTSVNTDIRQYI